jgi:hypothetical protein
MSGPLPFSREQFFAVFALYNEAVWPAHVIAYGLGLAAVAVALRRRADRPRGDMFVAATLALMWLFAGAAYHLMFFSAINALAPLFAALFVAEAGILAFFGVVRRRIAFGVDRKIDAIVGLSFVLYAMLLYPAIGFWAEGTHRTLPMFGIAPCPVTVFTFGMLLLTRGPTPWLALAPPLIWSVIGGSAAVLLGVVQDWALLASGPITLALLVWRRAGRGSALQAR